LAKKGGGTRPGEESENKPQTRASQNGVHERFTSKGKQKKNGTPDDLRERGDTKTPGGKRENNTVNNGRNLEKKTQRNNPKPEGKSQRKAPNFGQAKGRCSIGLKFWDKTKRCGRNIMGSKV